MNKWTEDCVSHPINLFRDCSLFIGSTGPVFWGTGQGLFFNASEYGTQRFFVDFFEKNNLSNYIL